MSRHMNNTYGVRLFFGKYLGSNKCSLKAYLSSNTLCQSAYKLGKLFVGDSSTKALYRQRHSLPFMSTTAVKRKKSRMLNL